MTVVVLWVLAGISLAATLVSIVAAVRSLIRHGLDDPHDPRR